MGILAWPLSRSALSIPQLLLAGVVALVGSVLLAPRRVGGSGALATAGLLVGSEPSAVSAVAGARSAGGRGPPLVAALIALAGLSLLGAGWAGVHEHRVDASPLGQLAPLHVVATGTMRSDPSLGRFGWSSVADLSHLRIGSTVVAVHESAWVEGDGAPPSAVRADRVELTGMLLRPEAGGFADYLRETGIAVEMKVDTFHRLGASSDPLVRAAQSFRAFVGESIRRLFPEKEAGLLMGLALGDASHLDAGLERDFRATGLGHLLVVSGENVAMVLAPVMALGMWLRLRSVPRFLFGAGTVLFFVVLTGAEPSVLRAGVMAGIALFGIVLGRPRSTASILSAAVLILLIVDPSLVWAIGFQLSVAATAGMVALASPLTDRLKFLPKPIALTAGTSLAAQMGVAPLLLYHFHEVPLVTLLANLLAFPGVAPSMLLGLAAAAIGLVVRPLGAVLALAAQVPLRYLEIVADRLASAPVPWITTHSGLATLVVGALVVIALARFLHSGRAVPRTAVVAGALLLPLFVWSTALQAGPPSGLVIRFFDVGQGDAALVTSPGGVSILVDGGPEPDQVATKLSALGIRRLDLVVATHPHADHIIGIPSVLARIPVGEVLDPGCPDQSSMYSDLVDAVHEEGIPVMHPRTGEVISLGDLSLSVLSPQSCWHDTNSDANNDSLVIKMSYREDTVLFGAEPEEPAQQLMLDDHEPLHAEVLKVPHHGSATSLPEFFQAVDPELAVVSVGPNTYGHPVPEVLDEIRATGARVMRTDRSGDITVTFAPEGLTVESSGP